jgi:predicted 3-demethylubiquinone-9 3-methyltransferase (glyoxalase superfamily)
VLRNQPRRAGGVEEQCGWLRDRHGVSWQIILLTRARRVTDAMLKIVKLDIAKLKVAYDGRS